MTPVWERLATPGTDPALLARVVARLLGPRGDPMTLAREAATRALRDGAGEPTLLAALAPPARSLRDSAVEPTLLAALAPAPDRAAAAAAEEAGRTWARLGVRAALAGDSAYPTRLARGWPAGGAPPLVAWRGPGEGLPDRAAVAIVGARRATGYGTGVAAWLAAAASDAGVLVISGGAVGVDAAAHAAALDGPGGTGLVLGCGHAVAYPRVHAGCGGLFTRILDAGGWLVGELPPTAPPSPLHVRARNRLVAGLVDAVVVVEGGPRSGSLRTAAVAAERGIPVLAVPGDVRAPGSAAPHLLLADGAGVCREPADLLATVGAEPAGSSSDPGGGSRPASALPEPVVAELARRWPRAIRLDELTAVTGVPAARLLAALTRARIAGEVAEGPDGIRLTRSPG